jgi:hypothetical protein
MKKIFSVVVAFVFWGCSTTKNQTESSAEISGSANSAAEKNSAEKKSVPAISNFLPKGIVVTLDDFEDENFWSALGATKKDDYSVTAKLCEEDWASSGENCGAWTFAAVPENFKATFFCNSLSTSFWENFSYIAVDINNLSRAPVCIQAEIQSGKNRTKTFTEEIWLGLGENKNVLFDLKHQIKNSADEEISCIPDADEVKTLSFVIRGKSKAGTIQVDNLRALK